jgi:hypothetical protein
VNIQKGASFSYGLMTSLMQSQSWKDSVMVYTYDEAGGLYDHVSPQPMPSPDGINSEDLRARRHLHKWQTGPTCDFVFTGYRIPLDRNLALHQEELRLPHRRGFDLDAEADRNSFQHCIVDRARRRAVRHDGVLRFRRRPVGQSTHRPPKQNTSGSLQPPTAPTH